MADETQFERESVSIDGAPTITFTFRGDTARAELADYKLLAETAGPDSTSGARMTIRDTDGDLVADLVVHARSDGNLTQQVIDIGSALLWSHWRYVEAERRAEG